MEFLNRIDTRTILFAEHNSGLAQSFTTRFDVVYLDDLNSEYVPALLTV